MINKSFKNLGIVFLVTLMSGNIFANKPVVGIGEITSNVGGNPQSFQTMLETAISQTNKFELMERSRMDDLLSEQALSAGGLTQGSGEIGGLSGVDYLVYGSITKLGTKSDAVALGGIAAGGQKSEMSVDIRIVDASTGSIRIAKTVQKQASSGGGFAMEGFAVANDQADPLGEVQRLTANAVAALLAMSFGFGSFWIDASAFSGSLIATLLVFTIASGNGNWGPTRLLLTGVVLASGFSAITTLILALSSEQTVRGMLFWMMGDLSFAYYPMHLIYLLIAITFITSFLSRYFDILARGEVQASILGIEVKFFRMMIFIITAVATSLSVTAVGVIGFVGLVVPHSVRLIVGSKHRYVFPASALAGGILLVIADTLARTILAPRQLPVGALTALIGVPLFIILMKKSLTKKR